MSLHCPHDGTALERKTYEGKIEIDACAACGGMWLDEGELEAIQDTRERDYEKALRERHDSIAAGVTQARQLQSATIACVECSKPLDKREYGYGSQVVIDTCADGCGLWLDRGEIEQLEKFFERSQKEAAGMIPLRWRLWATLHDLFGSAKKKKKA